MTSDPLPAGAPGDDAALFREVVGRFATGVAVVTTVAGAEDHAMTVNAFTSVSLEPLLVLFCAEKIARFHDVVLDTGLWAVSILPDTMRDASEWFATRGRALDGQLDGRPHTRGPATGAAVLAGAVAALECRTHAVHDGGDHSIVVGEVLTLDTPAPHAAPLIYYRGGYL
ncbi:flavin reductase [Actinomadura graeca]|uniref:Flavin reductase n=1 Tax=Actinomadura graeca TaxID=2750812 RepID=A0ABX8R071_9ACTN|nr:flavin reductase family protein [Actinomadura graeca]QXJ24490.1 flavin reductase [Actinomadura graeca]